MIAFGEDGSNSYNISNARIRPVLPVYDLVVMGGKLFIVTQFSGRWGVSCYRFIGPHSVDKSRHY